VIISGLNIAAGHIYDLADMENIVLAIFPNVFLQVPVQSAGHKNTCLLLGKMCLTSHICSTAILAKARGGAHIQLASVS
jgi:hypothetical protein